MSKRFSFLCHRCGECCRKNSFSNVSLTLDELYDFRDVFPISMSYYVQRLDKKLVEFYKQYAHGIPDDGVDYIDETNHTVTHYDTLPDIHGTVGDYSFGAFMNFHGITFRRKGCSKLSPDGTCSVHKNTDRFIPVVCRTVPLDSKFLRCPNNTMLESMLQKELDFYIKQGCVKVDDGKKPLPLGFIPFFSNESFVEESPIVKAMWEENVEHIVQSDDTHFLSMFYSHFIKDNYSMLFDKLSMLSVGEYYSVTLPFSYAMIIIIGIYSNQNDDKLLKLLQKCRSPLLSGGIEAIRSFVIAQEQQYTKLFRRNIPKDRVREVLQERDNYRDIIRNNFI